MRIQTTTPGLVPGSTREFTKEHATVNARRIATVLCAILALTLQALPVRAQSADLAAPAGASATPDAPAAQADVVFAPASKPGGNGPDGLDTDGDGLWDGDEANV